MKDRGSRSEVREIESAETMEEVGEGPIEEESIE